MIQQTKKRENKNKNDKIEKKIEFSIRKLEHADVS